MGVHVEVVPFPQRQVAALSGICTARKCRAQLAGGVTAEIGALFCLVPMMISCRVGSELLESAVAFIPGVRHRRNATEEEDIIPLGQAAQSCVERG